MNAPSSIRVAHRYLQRQAMSRGDLRVNLQSALDHLIDGDADEAIAPLELAVEHYEMVGDDEAWDELNDVLLDAEAGKTTSQMTRVLDNHIRHASTKTAGSWDAAFDALDAAFPRWNPSKVTDWNKVYAEFRGLTNDAGAAAHYYSEYRGGRMTRDEAIKGLLREGVKAPNLKMGRLPFQKQKIVLKLRSGDYPVDAEVVGSWAVHLDTPPPEPPTMPGWVVTFIPSSQRLTWQRSKTDAKRILEKVLRAAPEATNARSEPELSAYYPDMKKAL